MNTRRCDNCVYAGPLRFGRRTLRACANRPQAPGELCVVRRSGSCGNFRPHRPPPLRLPPPEPPNDQIRYIPLTQGKFAIVDADDYEWLSKYKWSASRAGATFYASRNHGRRTVLMHRLIMNPPDGMVVDHIDGNGLNNRRGDLRICTQQENMRNIRTRHGSSVFTGVTRDGDRWKAQIKHKGKTHTIGRFDDEVQAAKARDCKAIELFGEFAYLNFPQDHPERPGRKPEARFPEPETNPNGQSSNCKTSRSKKTPRENAKHVRQLQHKTNHEEHEGPEG